MSSVGTNVRLCTVLAIATILPVSLFGRALAASGSSVYEGEPAASRVMNDLGSAESETEPNDDCSNPDPANLLTNSVLAELGSSGDVDWFVVDGQPGDCLTVTTWPAGDYPTDTELLVYSATACDSTDQPLARDDDSGIGVLSHIEGLLLPEGGQYAVLVKHYTAQGTGAYSISAAISDCAGAPPNDTCLDAERLICDGSTIERRTDGSANDISSRTAPACMDGSSGEGGDVFFEVCVPAGQTLAVTVDPLEFWDPAIWLLEACPGSGNCLSASDIAVAGSQEMVSWDNRSEEERCVVISVDSWHRLSAGRFSLRLECQDLVPASTKSWSAIKASFGWRSGS